MRTDVLGVGFDDIDMDEAADRALSLMKERRAAYAVTPNPEIVWLCRTDTRLKKAVDGAALVIPDGIGVIYGAKILGRPLKGKLPGIDFAARLFAEMAKSGKSVYLLGAKPGVALAAAENLKARYEGLAVAGTHDGYFKDDAPVIDDINNRKPDLLLVCLGAPKQEYWMSDNAKKLDVGFMAGLGGSLDVFAGVVERAPENWRRLNLEWLYRLTKEPKRITRMIKLPMFLLAVIGRRIRRG